MLGSGSIRCQVGGHRNASRPQPRAAPFVMIDILMNHRWLRFAELIVVGYKIACAPF